MAEWNDWTNASVHQETHEFMSCVASSWVMLIQMKWMDEDDMQMFGLVTYMIMWMVGLISGYDTQELGSLC